MINNQQDDVLMCMRVGHCPDPVAGATVRKCSQCGQDVWVSPVSIELLKKKPLDLWCDGCIKSNLPEIPTFVLTPEHLTEIVEHFKAKRLGGNN